MQIKVTTQAELDAIALDFEGEIIITGGSCYDPIIVSKVYGSATVLASGSATVLASGSATVLASGSAMVQAWDSAMVHAWDSAMVQAWDSAMVHAWGSATVHASDSATVRASGSATVRASGSATVHAWGSATVRAWGSATVRASDSAMVQAWGSATVHAWGSATVRAWGSATVDLFGFAVAMLMAVTAKAVKKSKTATIVNPKQSSNAKEWLSEEVVEVKRGNAIIFKRVSKDFKTQEGTENETAWTPGLTLEHSNYDPKSEECGSGKFHACSQAWFCDEFRNKAGDRYIALSVAVKDLFVWPGNRSYPHKVAFRKGTVLYECDSSGRELKNAKGN